MIPSYLILRAWVSLSRNFLGDLGFFNEFKHGKCMSAWRLKDLGLKKHAVAFNKFDLGAPDICFCACKYALGNV